MNQKQDMTSPKKDRMHIFCPLQLVQASEPHLHALVISLCV